MSGHRDDRHGHADTGQGQHDHQAPRNGSGTPEDAPLATEDAYRERTEETKPVIAPDSGLKFIRRDVPPAYVMSLQDRFNLSEERAQELQRSPEHASEETKADTVGFMRAMLVDNIVEPVVYWPDTDGGAPDRIHEKVQDPQDPLESVRDAFNLTVLTDDDMAGLMADMMGEDPEEARERVAEQRSRLEGNPQR